VACPLRTDRAHDLVGEEVVELLVGSTAAEDRPQIELLEREQAGPQLALGGHADAVALLAERLGHAGDHADVADAVGIAEALGRLHVLAVVRSRDRQVLEGEHGVDALEDLVGGNDLIAAPLALCESEGLSGKDLIFATIIAYEIEMRLCEVGRPGVREYGWHHATLSAFAAPVAAGRVLNLTVDQMVSAMGISAARSFSPGAVTAGKLTNMKNTVDPWAGRMGAESALLARGGFSGPEHIIDGKEGLFAVFKHVQYKGQPATFDGEALVKDLPNSTKSHYRILDCGMKSFPIEALSHAPLTAMMKTVKENNVKADDVKEIRVEVIARAADILGDPHKYRPDSKETADHSLPYCMAVGLVDGMVTPLQFKEERVLDKSLIPIMDKVKVIANEEFEALFPKFQPSRVTITTNDGKTHSTRVDVPKGDPRDPMTEDEIAVKFTALGGDVIGKDQCKKLQRFIMSMETADKLDGLFELTTAR